MPVITLFSPVFCHGKTIAERIAEKTDHTLIVDRMVIHKACRLSDIPEKKLRRAFCTDTSAFNAFSFEKERSISYLKLALANLFKQHKNCLVYGYTSTIAACTRIMPIKVCLTAGNNYQERLGRENFGLSRDQVIQKIEQDVIDKSCWVSQLLGLPSPWDPSIYDLIISIDRLSLETACKDILHFLLQQEAADTKIRGTLLDDVLLAAEIETCLADAGHHVHVDVLRREAVLTINKKVLMAERLIEELNAIVKTISGVQRVEIKIKHAPDSLTSYRKIDHQLPSKVLLVDDEAEFVQTLSERLQMRDIVTAVAFDGESALDLINDDTPEVMIIDLKMPGMDGVKLLELVKSSQPTVEVIVLTGHGSEQDKQLCMSLGAFAYLQKPVDINSLTDTLKNAYSKVKQT